MKLEQSFEVAAPLEQVWQTLIDVEHVAPCLPGAAVTGRNDDGSYNGTFTVKIGPTTASYTGKLEMENIDEASHTATMQAQGTDKRGQGGAKATILSRLAPADGHGTRVEVVTDYHITGRLARFGRGGMIEDISERLLREFAKRLQSSLASRPDTMCRSGRGRGGAAARRGGGAERAAAPSVGRRRGQAVPVGGRGATVPRRRPTRRRGAVPPPPRPERSRHPARGRAVRAGGDARADGSSVRPSPAERPSPGSGRRAPMAAAEPPAPPPPPAPAATAPRRAPSTAGERPPLSIRPSRASRCRACRWSAAWCGAGSSAIRLRPPLPAWPSCCCWRGAGVGATDRQLATRIARHAARRSRAVTSLGVPGGAARHAGWSGCGMLCYAASAERLAAGRLVELAAGAPRPARSG